MIEDLKKLDDFNRQIKLSHLRFEIMVVLTKIEHIWNELVDILPVEEFINQKIYKSYGRALEFEYDLNFGGLVSMFENSNNKNVKRLKDNYKNEQELLDDVSKKELFKILREELNDLSYLINNNWNENKYVEKEIIKDESLNDRYDKSTTYLEIPIKKSEVRDYSDTLFDVEILVYNSYKLFELLLK